MEIKGILKDVTKDWISGKFRVTFETEQNPAGMIVAIQNKLLRITAKQWRDKRSLDANSYYWVLVTKLAESLHISKPRCHNLILRRYGQNLTVDGHGAYIRIPDTEKAEETALEASEWHIRPTSEVIEGTDGVNYRTYIMLKGSSYYDSEEMSHLIDGIIDECKSAGIETLPPDELARMLSEYEENYKKYHRG